MEATNIGPSGCVCCSALAREQGSSCKGYQMEAGGVAGLRGCAREGKLFEGSTYERQVVIRVSEVPNTLCTASTSDRDSGRGGV
jgi:hypothetical protein